MVCMHAWLPPRPAAQRWIQECTHVASLSCWRWVGCSPTRATRPGPGPGWLVFFSSPVLDSPAALSTQGDGHLCTSVTASQCSLFVFFFFFVAYIAVAWCVRLCLESTLLLVPPTLPQIKLILHMCQHDTWNALHCTERATVNACSFHLRPWRKLDDMFLRGGTLHLIPSDNTKGECSWLALLTWCSHKTKQETITKYTLWYQKWEMNMWFFDIQHYKVPVYLSTKDIQK